jgi:hypothetical protein
MISGRVQLAFTDDALVWEPTWTSLDTTDSLVASYTIDRGRVYELDQTDGGRATVDILDRDGLLDPTNPDGPHYGLIEPLIQCRLRSWNPVTATMQPRFRGWVSDWTYDFDPSQQVNRLTLELTDLFEILGAIDMIPVLDFDTPGEHFGLIPPEDSAGQIYYPEQNMDDRVEMILSDAGIPEEFAVVFSGNVKLKPTVYSPGETPLAAIQEAVDAEFPGVSNAYTDRQGRLAVHGRLAKFDPAGVLAGATPGSWDWHHWQAGDLAAVQADLGSVAQLRQFGFNRGVSKIINSALATPDGIDDADVPGQVVRDTTSIARYGTRSWSAQTLITKTGLLDGSTALEETKRFATYYVDNYAQPRNRVDGIGFRTIRPDNPGGHITWQLLTEIDVSDQIDITVGSPGGGGFTTDPYYVEGVHETVQPLNADYDDITLTLDLSPKAYFDTNPFPTS